MLFTYVKMYNNFRPNVLFLTTSNGFIQWPLAGRESQGLKVESQKVKDKVEVEVKVFSSGRLRVKSRKSEGLKVEVKVEEVRK